MRLPKAHWDGVADGSITVAFRRMRKPTVKTGGTLRTVVGVLAIDAIEPIGVEDITEADIQRAGYPDRQTLLSFLPSEGTLYRIEFHVQGPDPRIALRERAEVDDEDFEALRRRLDRFDASSREGPWTRTTLTMIRDQPGTRAPDLAASVGRDTLPFKRDVRKLKELGLTESLVVGYRLSPRGETVVRRLGL